MCSVCNKPRRLQLPSLIAHPRCSQRDPTMRCRIGPAPRESPTAHIPRTPGSKMGNYLHIPTLYDQRGSCGAAPHPLTQSAGRLVGESWRQCELWMRCRCTNSSAEGSVQKWSAVFILVYSNAQGPTAQRKTQTRGGHQCYPTAQAAGAQHPRAEEAQHTLPHHVRAADNSEVVLPIQS